MDQKTVLGYGLWLFACKRFCRLLEVTNNGLEHGVSILNYNRCIETLSLNGSICCFHREAIRGCKLFKPFNEQSVALIFTSITGVANIQQDISVLCKELFYDGNQSIFYMCIVPRMGILALLKAKLISITTRFSGRIFPTQKLPLDGSSVHT